MKKLIFIVLIGCTGFYFYFLSKNASSLISSKSIHSDEIKLISKNIMEHLDKVWQRLPQVAQKTSNYHSFRINQCFSDDMVVHNIEKSVIDPIVQSVLSQNLNSLPQSFSLLKLNYKMDDNKKIDDGVTISKILEDLTQSQTMKEYLSSFDSIIDLSWEVSDYSIEYSDRDEFNNFNKITLLTDFDFRAESNDLRTHDQFKLYIKAEKKKGQWELTQIKPKDGMRLTSVRKPSFRDITSDSGLNQIPVHLRREAIRRGGYSVAVTDINNDNIQDLYIGSGGKGNLLIGEKAADSVRFNPLDSKLNDSTFVKSSIFADFDNDGDQDAMLVRFVSQGHKNKQIVYLENNNGVFVEKNQAFSDSTFYGSYAMPAAVGDFNKDSYLDLYVGFPGREDFTTLENKPSQNQAHGLFYSSQGKEFLYRSKDIKYDFETTNVFPHSAMAVDYNQDHNTDILIIDDRNNLSPLLKNTGKEFEQVAEEVGLGNNGYGMSIAAGDFNGDGLIDFAMTNVVTRADQRLRNGCYKNWNAEALDFHEVGLRLFQNMGEGHFTDVTRKSNISWPGGATAGLIFFDYNNDGLDDLYVTNGLWSGNERSNDLSTLWSQLKASRYVSETLQYSNKKTNTELMNLLINYQGDFYTQKEKKNSNPSFSGFQRNRLYKNTGNGQFVDMGFIEGIDRIEDGYAVTSLDLNKDGRLDLLLRNADPGVESNKFSPVLLFTNNNDSKKNYLSFKLESKNSNWDAIGTEIVVTTQTNKQVKQLLANNGPQQNERILHFGIGNNKEADVLIQWPNGYETTLRGLKAGHHILTDALGVKKIVKK